MDPKLQSTLIFAAVACVGMIAHYVKSWYQGQITGSLVNYLFKDNPRATVAAFCGVLSATAAAYLAGSLDNLTLNALLPFAFGTGFTMDSTLNKSASAPTLNTGASSKQGGFSSLSLLLGTAVLAVGGTLVLGLHGCATTPTAQSVAYDAQLTADAAVKQIPPLLRDGVISQATASQIRSAAVAVYLAASAVQGCGSDACSTVELDTALAALVALAPPPPHK